MGQGILDEAQAMLKKAGNTIAMSQRMVFHFRRFFFSVVCISNVFFRLWLVRFTVEVQNDKSYPWG